MANRAAEEREIERNINAHRCLCALQAFEEAVWARTQTLFLFSSVEPEQFIMSLRVGGQQGRGGLKTEKGEKKEEHIEMTARV